MNRIVKQIAKPFNLCISSVSPSCFGRWTNISFVLMLTAFWLVGIPAGAKSINTVSSQSNMVAVADTSMVAYIEKKTGFQIPAEYRNKIDSIFKDNYPHIKVEIDGINSWEFTVDFVLNEMKSDWGIGKDNQFLFILDSFCELLSGRGVYDGEDGDSKRLEEFEKALDNIDVCSKRYKEGIMPFIDKQKAEYRRQSAEARQQSAEARQQSAEARQQIIKGLNETLASYKELYSLEKEHPGDERLKKSKSNARELIRLCKKYGVDYKAVLSTEMLKFYGIEE